MKTFIRFIVPLLFLALSFTSLHAAARNDCPPGANTANINGSYSGNVKDGSSSSTWDSYSITIPSDGELTINYSSTQNTRVWFTTNNSNDCRNNMILSSGKSASSTLNVSTAEIVYIQLRERIGGGNTANYSFSLSFSSLNTPPTNISIASSDINENELVNTTVGLLSTTDVDSSDTHQYTLVSGTGDSDNGSFTIIGNTLKSSEIFDYETKSSYSIRIQSNDGKGGVFSKLFTITVNDLSPINNPVVTSPDKFLVPENTLFITTLTASDPDNDTLSFSIPNSSLLDSAKFSLTSTGVLSFIVPQDYEYPADNDENYIYEVQIQVSDGTDGFATQNIKVEISNVDTDLSIAKFAPGGSVTLGEEFNYTLYATNNGPDVATEVRITDTLPSGMTYINATGANWSCNHISGTVTCNYAIPLNIGAGTSAITLTVLSPPTEGDITNTAEVTSPTPDTDSSNDTIDVTTTVVSNASDLSISMTSTPEPDASTTSTITYSISVDNAGPNPAKDVIIRDVLVNDLSFISIDDGNNGNTWSCSTGLDIVCTYIANAGILDVGANSGTITIVVRAPSFTTVINNEASVESFADDIDDSDNTVLVDTNILDGIDINPNEEAFSKYLQYNIFGDMTMISNANVNKPSWHSAESYNDRVDMRYVDTDSDSSTFNSSSSTLILDKNSTIKWAGLYWQARVHCKSSFSSLADARNHMDDILLKTPNNTSYIPIQANKLNYTTPASDSSARLYGAFADITNILANDETGIFTVANIVSCEGKKTGGGNYGGWTILVIYEDASIGFKNISVFNGFEFVNDIHNPSYVLIDGFVTPLTGSIKSTIAYFGGDGDPVDGGSAKAPNLSSGIFENIDNGNINLLNSESTGVSGQTYGIDADLVDVSEYITNNQNSITFSFDAGTSDDEDHYTLNMFAFATDMYTPLIDNMQKTATVNGLPGGPGVFLHPGDVVTYTLKFENSGTGETATEVEIFDNFDDDNLSLIFDINSFDASSIKLSHQGSSTWDSSANCGYDNIQHKVWCKLASVADGESYTMQFNATVKSNPAALASVINVAYSRYRNETTGEYVIVPGTGGHGGSSNANDAGTTILVTVPPTGSENPCGIFSSVLTSYLSIASNGANIQACYTDNISYPVNMLTGYIACNQTSCGGGSACDRIDPPTQRLDYNVTATTVNGTSTAGTTLTNLEYGNLVYGNNNHIYFNPAFKTSPDNDIKLMILGDVSISKGSTLNFFPGDYHFRSLTIDGNNNNIVLPIGGNVRLFIDGDLSVDMNNLSFNANGSAEDLFVYVGGNFESIGSGGGTTSWKAFMYVEGDVELDNNSNNWKIYGGITAEGAITINGNNPDFIQGSSPLGLGFEECVVPGVIITGPFTSWDVGIPDTPTPPLANLRVVKTKIVNKEFDLVVAHLDQLQQNYETIGVDAVEVAIYTSDLTNKISSSNSFNVNSTAKMTLPFLVDIAEREATLGFTLCSSYADDGTGSYVHTILPATECTGVATTCAHPSITAQWRVCSWNNDHFAIRPKEFSITPQTTDIKSGLDTNFNIQASDYFDTPSNKYTVSNSDYNFDTTEVKYMPNDVINNSLYGTLDIIDSYSFIDGLSDSVSINYSDIGKVEITIKDEHWADIDLYDGSTQEDRYIVGETNATFIPSHFVLDNASLHDHNDSNFTYISSDLNISARIALKVTAQNAKDATTKNFDSLSWEEEVNIGLVVHTAQTPTIITNAITSKKLKFKDGEKLVTINEADDSKNLLFNFTRAIDTVLNPFLVNGADVEINISSDYGGISIIEKATPVVTDNATFIYGRTNVPRSRFGADLDQTAFIYYEAYCNLSQADINTVACNKALLPNGATSAFTNDPRWFVNTQHTNTVFGRPGVVNQKSFDVDLGIVRRDIALTAANTGFVVLDYDSSKGNPYKTTMENNASQWLLYNRFKAGDDKNEFEVEFEDSAGTWAGKNYSDSTTITSGNENVNRRSMW